MNTVKLSWRYYITYCKALETIIDSNHFNNEKQLAHGTAPHSDKSLISNKQNTKQRHGVAKSWNTIVNTERKEAINTLFIIMQDKATAQPVITHVCQLIAKEMTLNPQLKIRELIVSRVETLLRSHEKKNKKAHVELIS